MPTLNTRIQQKIDTEENYTSRNPILLKNEIVYVETADGIKMKKGDGSSNFNTLPYMNLGGINANVAIAEHNASPDAHSGMGWITTADAAPGDVEDFGIDADTLGGIAADQYALKSEITGEIDLTGYVTTTTAEATYAKKTDLSNYALASSLQYYATTESLNNYITTQDFNDTIGNINDLLDIINGEVIE